MTPFAVQPGQVLMPESCAVALRIDGGGGQLGGGVAARRGGGCTSSPAPEGWLAGAGLWSRDGVLQLPYANGAVPCGVALIEARRRRTAAGDRRDGRHGRHASGTEPSGAVTPPVVCKPVPLRQAPLHRAAPPD